MIRAGFVFEQDGSWLGGVNYFRNLFKAVQVLPERQIEAVLFIGRQSRVAGQFDLPAGRIVRSSMLDRHSLLWWARKITLKLFKRDLFLERLLTSNRIAVLSHSGSLGKGSRIPCLCWMADFQHRHLPHFFAAAEIGVRDRIVEAWQSECAAIVLSSEDARKDLQAFYPSCRARLEVLPFVAEVGNIPDADTYEMLCRQYRLTGKFFLVANQFWAHKNHQVVVDALKYLAKSGRTVQVIASGNPADYRQSGHYRNLMSAVQEAGLQDSFCAVGVIPFAHLSALMRHAVAMLNPSLFEGWNTSVEEAKSLGKQVLLSDIPVHREQHPQRGYYFTPDDAAQLAELMWQLHEAYDPLADAQAMQRATEEFPARQQAFGYSYQQMVLRLPQDK